MCTDFILPFEGTNPIIVSGRTMDFGEGPTTVDTTQLIKVPVGLTFQASAPGGGGGYTWENKYGFVGVAGGTKDGKPSTDPTKYFFCDGLNTEGLSAGALWLSYSDYEPPGPPDRCLDIESLTAFVLGMCATVDEVQARLKNLTVWFPQKWEALLPNHLSVHDRNGKSLVLEFIRGQKIYYNNNDIGVLTNDPTFDFHATSYYYSYKGLSPKDNVINRYIQFTKGEDGRNDIACGDGYQYEVLGSGTIGLPGDSSSPSRFIRTAKLRACTAPATSLQEGVQYAVQLLGRVAVCSREVLTVFDSSGKPTHPRNVYDRTVWQLVRAHSDRILYYRTELNHNIFAIDLKSLDFSRGAASTSIPIENQNWFTDSTSQLG